MIVEARVIRSFRHTNTGRVWFEGDVFSGTEEAARQLAKMGYLEPAKGGATAKASPPLATLTVKELAAICDEENIEIPKKPRKADLIAAIEAARG